MVNAWDKNDLQTILYHKQMSIQLSFPFFTYIFRIRKEQLFLIRAFDHLPYLDDVRYA